MAQTRKNTREKPGSPYKHKVHKSPSPSKKKLNLNKKNDKSKKNEENMGNDDEYAQKEEEESDNDHLILHTPEKNQLKKNQQENSQSEIKEPKKKKNKNNNDVLETALSDMLKPSFESTDFLPKTQNIPWTASETLNLVLLQHSGLKTAKGILRLFYKSNCSLT